jgi:unsaturated pyranuronate lyase
MSICCKVDDLSPKTPLPGARRRIISGKNLMFAKAEIAKGVKIPLHRHSHEQFIYILEGRLEVIWGEDKKVDILGTGQIIFYTEDTPHESRALEDTIVLKAFGPVVEAYLQETTAA